MKLMTLKEQLEKHNLKIFSINDVAKITEQNKHTMRVFLNRQVKNNHLTQLKKGYYAFKEINKFELNKLFKNTYIALNSALEYYQTTTQRYINLELISKNTLKNQTIENIKINIHKTKHFFGYEKVIINNTEVFISNKEKTLIDCLLFSVYLTEINEFIKKSSLNINKLKQYLNQINSSTLNKRIGYLLELNNMKIDLKINNKYEKLNKDLKITNKKNKKWKLIINEALEWTKKN